MFVSPLLMNMIEAEEAAEDRKRRKARERQRRWKEKQNLEMMKKKNAASIPKKLSDEGVTELNQSSSKANDKRPRSINWEETEKRFLLECIKDHIALIENVRPDMDTNKKKKAIWDQVEEQFTQNGFNRDVIRIKQQWRRLKANAKRNYKAYKHRLEENGGDGTVIEKPSELDFMICNLLSEENTFDIDGNMSDSDSGVCEKKPRLKFDGSFNDESNVSWSALDFEDLNSSNISEVQVPVLNKFQQNEINDKIKQIEDIKVELSDDSDEEFEINEDDESTKDDILLENLIDTIPENENMTVDNLTETAISNDLPVKKEIPLNTKLPPLHRIVQEPVVHRPPSSLQFNYNHDQETLKTDNDLTDQADLIKLKRRLLLANIERIEKQKKLDLELHEQKMKIEFQLGQRKLRHLDYIHKLKIALEKRYYKRRLEFLALNEL